MQKIKTPECDKMLSLEKERNIIGDFLTWLNAEGYWICELKQTECNDDIFHPMHKSIEHWIAEHLKLNMAKIEKERRAILEEVRKLNP